MVMNGKVYETKGELSRLRDEERLVSEQTSKGTVEALARDEPCGGKDIVGFPRLAGQPRTPSLIIGLRDEQHYGVGRGHKGVLDVKLRLDCWMFLNRI